MRDHARMQEGEPLFYFAAMSPYSWLAAERIGRLLPDALWRPVTAAFVFKAAGRTSWGFTGERLRGLADCSARADSHGLGPITWPEPWPTNDLPVARAMAYADGLGLLKPYALSAMRLAFQEGADLAELETLLEAARRCSIPEADIAAAVEDADVKQRLRELTDEAIARGVFGIPTVIVGEELFWGDDRLQEAADAYSSPARRTA